MKNSDIIYEVEIDVDEEIKRAIEDFFRPFASGNEGYVRVEEYDRNAAEIRFSCLIRHKHTQKIAGRIVTVYAMKSYAKGRIDIVTPESSDMQICFDTPAGQACVDIRTLIEVILAILAA